MGLGETLANLTKEHPDQKIHDCSLTCKLKNVFGQSMFVCHVICKTEVMDGTSIFPFIFAFCINPQVAYRTVQHALSEKQRRLKRVLDIPDDEKEEHAQYMQDKITDYFRLTGARLKLDSVKRVGFGILQSNSLLEWFSTKC